MPFIKSINLTYDAIMWLILVSGQSAESRAESGPQNWIICASNRLTLATSELANVWACEELWAALPHLGDANR
ncbi:hypothetical protein CHELA20_20006 [Hyphomicrobiales bacterium]|nr:hypothetical protein CHELA41_10045 [Hyphomicrobiales bacterium]CAH1660921.1 hypothetical protein CHELA20_20006 [Hyphomicrobiales bacterium]CAH1693382.1 hypothetical protein BOSEA31B_30038 [Hyphomicrobiales bacterium]CAH1703060.1 hypothetical protein BOSEA1005_40048 [Hyphomicrobiales bacterium]